MCLDAEVKRGAECNTDHQFLCARIRGGRGELQKEGTSEWRGGGRYNVSKLIVNSEGGERMLVGSL